MVSFSKRQTRVIIALNLVVVLLLGGLLIVYPFEKGGADPVLGGEAHDVYRSARVSLSVDLDFETNIGGTQSEEIIACFASPDSTKIHIFGNTASKDLDFEGSGIFFVITDRKAKIERVCLLGGENDVLKKVILAEGGYLLAIESKSGDIKSTYLLHVSFEGATLKRLEHVAIGEENVADLILMENCYMLIVHSGISLIDFFDIKVFFYDLDFKVLSTVTIQNPSYSQQYLYVLPKGLDKFVMAVAYKSQLWNGMALVELSMSTSKNYKIEMENSYTPKGFMPVSGGYAVLTIDSAGRASMIILTSSYTLKEKKYLVTAAEDASLFFANQKYYAYIKTAERTAVLAFDMAMSAYEDLMLFYDSDVVYATYMQGSGTLFACGGNDATIIGLSESMNYLKRVGSSGTEDNTRLVFLGSDVYLICESTGNDGDVGGNFGGKDIWIAKISV